MTGRDKRWSLAIAAMVCTGGEGLYSLAGVANQPKVSIANRAAPIAVGESTSRIAAMVDDHSIPLIDVEMLCLRNQRGYVVDQMIQSYVVGRECKRRGITFSDAEIDSQVADLRKQYAPATLEDSLKDHGWTMAELREQLRFKIGRRRLVDDAIKPVKMAHCRDILVKCGGSSGRTEEQALAVIKGLQEKLRQGKDFGTLAAQYSEAETRTKNGDIGVLYGNILGNVDPAVLAEALALGSGEVSKSPVKAVDGHCLVQVISTNTSHTPVEDALYKTAGEECRKTQAMFLEPKVVGDLISSSKITYADDADISVGKPLPTSAATIDGYTIPMKDVLAKCLAQSGAQTVDILVQDYVVDRECARRKINVTEAEIDQSVAELRRRIAPHTIEEGLPIHHITMDGLRQQFKQEIERTKLVADQVKPTKMVHCRIIPSLMPHSRNSAAVSVADTQDKSRDLGILYPGIQNIDTAILQTALTMKTGQTTPQAVKTLDGSTFVQVLSTGDNHAPAEDASYAAALNSYQEQQAQPLIPQEIMALVKKAKVVLYVH